MTAENQQKRMGRPPSAAGTKRTALLQIRTTLDRKARVGAIASRDGVSVAALIERLIDAAT